MAEQATAISSNTTTDDKFVKPVHYAQEDMRKEKQCTYGKGCVKRDRPFACALNHDGKGDIIKCGTELTEEIICPFERPPFQRCGDGRCTKIHLENRAEFIEQKKKQFFSGEQQDKPSYSSVTGELNEKNNNVTAVIATSSEGTKISMTRKDALAVAVALKVLEQQEQKDEAAWDGPRTLFQADTSSSSASTTDDEEDDEDLSDPATFAARLNANRGAEANAI